MTQEEVLEVVLTAVSEEADDLGYDELCSPTAETPLYGNGSGIDSLSLVRVVAALERAAEVRFGKNVVLADDRAMSMRNSPFRTVGALAGLLHDRLVETDG